MSTHSYNLDPTSTSQQINSSLQPIQTSPSITRSFYQRQLPQNCISFTSQHGKQLFRNALDAGHMESFFPLASQLVTQHEPSFCGLATLCTVLNALGVDPKRVWKHPWRWFEQDMLDCCRPLKSIRQNGITLAEFNCLARCNGLHLITYSPSPEISTVGLDGKVVEQKKLESLQELRSNVARVTSSSSQFLIASFSRSTLGQTGSGHFSPIAGYSPTDDRVLILDVARFKYPSYWVHLQDLYDSMIPIDPASGTPRGYSILSHTPLNQINCQNCHPPNSPSITRIDLNKSSWYTLSKELDPILKSLQSQPDPTTGIRSIYGQLSKHFNHIPNLPIEIRPGLKEEEDDDEQVKKGQTIKTVELFEQLSNLISSFKLVQQDSSLSDLNNRPQLLLLFSLAILPQHQFISLNLNFSCLELELIYLRAQLDALNECCSIENHNSSNFIQKHLCECNELIS